MSNFFNFKGRVNRAKYFLYLLATSFIGGISDIVLNNTDNITIIIVLAFFNIVLLVKYICVTIQRFHDIERPGTHFWLLLIPFYNIYIELVLLFKKGTEGPNKFGDDPLTLKQEIISD
jgi:uncharacterized membrane protein YhaH (DUF805 family)